MKIVLSLIFVVLLEIVFYLPLVFTFARLIGAEWKCSTRERIVAYVVVFAAIFASVVYSIDDKKVIIFETILFVMNVLDILLQIIVSKYFGEAKNEEW